jgi:NAD+ diphosphatase
VRRPNSFTGQYIERAAHLRKDAAHVASALADPSSVLVPVWRDRSYMRRAADGVFGGFVAVTHEIRMALPDEDLVMLGHYDGRTYFAVDLSSHDEAPQLLPDASFEDLRFLGGQLPGQEGGVLAYARAMVHWRSKHRYCGVCGAPNRSDSAGHVMKCSNLACHTEHFPRLDPAIIVLVSDGERALLGRQASWPAGRYSTIAGFVEPGESLEDAVAREVLEETGVSILSADYHSSQPWPFPASLMLGFLAVAAPGAVARADEELEDARWFTREQIASGTPGLPPPQSISYRLIEDWYDAGASLPLRQTPGVAPWEAKSR